MRKYCELCSDGVEILPVVLEWYISPGFVCWCFCVVSGSDFWNGSDLDLESEHV